MTTAFAQTLATLMRTRRLSQQEVAASGGLNPGTISRLMNSQSRPERATVTALFRVFTAESERAELLGAWLRDEVRHSGLPAHLVIVSVGVAEPSTIRVPEKLAVELQAIASGAEVPEIVEHVRSFARLVLRHRAALGDEEATSRLKQSGGLASVLSFPDAQPSMQAVAEDATSLVVSTVAKSAAERDARRSHTKRSQNKP